MRFLFPIWFVAFSFLARAATTESIHLSGRGADDAVPWDFYCTAGRNSGVWTTIPVPSCWEQEGFGAYEYGVESRGSTRLPVRPPPPRVALDSSSRAPSPA